MGIRAVFIAVVFRQHYVGMYVHIQYTTVTFKHSIFFKKLAEPTIKYLTDLLVVGPEVESFLHCCRECNGEQLCTHLVVPVGFILSG